jgi:hypothetical protein
MINSQNITVFNVELGFTTLPHLPDCSGAQHPGAAYASSIQQVAESTSISRQALSSSLL